MDYSINSSNCYVCNKKIKLVNLHHSICKCNLYFCSIHLPSNKHSCNFDYKKENTINLQKNNPVITFKKI